MSLCSGVQNTNARQSAAHFSLIIRRVQMKGYTPSDTAEVRPLPGGFVFCVDFDSNTSPGDL